MGCCTCFLPQLGFVVWFTDQEDDCWEKNMDFKRIAMIIWSPAYALFVPFAKREEKCNKEDLLLTKQWDINPFTSPSCMNGAEVMLQWVLFRVSYSSFVGKNFQCVQRYKNDWFVILLLAIHYLTLTFTSPDVGWKFELLLLHFSVMFDWFHVHFPLIVSLLMPILYESSLN